MFGSLFKKATFVLSILVLSALVFFIFVYRGSSEKGLNSVDSNGNGIWDDYEFVINDKFKKYPNVKNAGFQMGKSLQIIIDDPSDALAKDKAFSKAMSCLVAAGIHDGLTIQDAAELIGQVRDIVVSTDTRQDRYIKFNVNLSGNVLDAGLPDIANCEFKVEKSQ